MLKIKQLSFREENFWSKLDTCLAWEMNIGGNVSQVVAKILADVKERGNQALLEYTNRFDRMQLSSAQALELSAEHLHRALAKIDDVQREALEKSASRIGQYAEHQKIESWSYTEEDGTVLGQKVTAMDRVGLYVPGGKAAYPSSVLMNAIPAKVAGVPELIMVVPTPDGEKN